jgi:hypothetical protein
MIPIYQNRIPFVRRSPNGAKRQLPTSARTGHRGERVPPHQALKQRLSISSRAKTDIGSMIYVQCKTPTTPPQIEQKRYDIMTIHPWQRDCVMKRQRKGYAAKLPARSTISASLSSRFGAQLHFWHLAGLLSPGNIALCMQTAIEPGPGQ